MTDTKVLIITGPVGVGKTSVAYEISEILEKKQVHNAVIDLDLLRHAFPRPKDDPYNMKLGYKNLASIWGNYKEIGVTHLMIPDIVESEGNIDSIRKAIPDSETLVVRLKAEVETLHKRIRNHNGRYLIEWHVERATQLHKEMEEKNLGDFVVDTENKSVEEVSSEIVSKLKLI
jgi:adenylylsulfate kinase